tara:strand:+ start:3478 stop:3966 length:489 start_codon:yes stop_codon:yes gene_type:complete
MSIKLEIYTNFIERCNLIAHVQRSDFIHEFVKILKENENSKNHRFEPLLEDGEKINNPQNLYYNEIPRFSIPFIELLDVDIHQKWEIDDDIFRANITVSLKGGQLFKILLNFKIKENTKSNKKLKIEIEGKWIEKIFIVPDFILEHITEEVKKIITRLLNKN